MSPRPTMSALVVREDSPQSLRLAKEQIPIPQPDRTQVLVKISHAAQNPTDVQSLDNHAFGEGAVLGCDFVGEVVEVGSSVRRYAKGDIIAGLIWGGETPGLGAYSEYTLADERISYPVPGRNISREQASKSDHELSAELFDKLPSWLEKGVLKPSHPKLRQGLESVPDGFQEYRDGRISGYKIVYALD